MILQSINRTHILSVNIKFDTKLTSIQSYQKESKQNSLILNGLSNWVIQNAVKSHGKVPSGYSYHRKQDHFIKE